MKRSRAPNFTTAEIMQLLLLVEKFPIIENKKTDGCTSKDKQEAWQKLTEEYNSQTKYSPRSVENLIACYKNQKIKVKKMYSTEKMAIKVPLLLDAVEEHGQNWEQVAQATNETNNDCQTTFQLLVKEAKKEESSYKKEINRTGGGPPPITSSTDPVMEKVKTLIGPSLEGLYTVYDGDSKFMKEQQDKLPLDKQIPQIEYPIECSPLIPIASTSTSEQNKSEFKRLNILKKKVDQSLKSTSKGKKNVSHSFQELAEDKKDLVKAQRNLVDLQLEHQQLQIDLAKEKLKFEKTKNEMELDFLKQKYILELDFLKNRKYE